MRKSLLFILSMLICACLCTAAAFAADGATVYVRDGGTGDGSSAASPLGTLNAAVSALGGKGGTVVACGDVTISDITTIPEQSGDFTLTAADGATGLALARQMRPRAILLDVMMPGMDGWTVLSRLKSDPDLAGIPVVMVTFVGERGLASSLGAVDYVSKPVKWDRFREVMDRFREESGDVLVVDDDPDARERVRHVLERDGWTVAEAGNGREALDRISEALPRVVLLDLTMPVMDGFSFLHELRARPDCRDIPVIVLSARDLTPAERQRLQSASQVMTKGEVTLREVTANVRALTQ